MTDLTDIVNQFTNLAQQENEEMFQQGILLAEAVAAGFKAADVKRECGIATGKTPRTIANRLAVGMVYGKDFYVDRDWSLHLATIQLSAVDLAKTETYQAAHDLMTLALKGDEDGRILTAKTLRQRIAPKAGNPKPEILLTADNVGVYMVDYPFASYVIVSLAVPRDQYHDELKGMAVQPHNLAITITRNPPLPESASAGESGVAA